MKIFISTLAILLCTTFLFSQTTEEPIYLLNNDTVDMAKVFLNPKSIDSIHIEKNKKIYEHGAVFLFTKDSTYSYLSLNDIIKEQNDSTLSQGNVIFRINNTIVKDTLGVKIDDSFFKYLSIERTHHISYLTETQQKIIIMNIELEMIKRPIDILIKGKKSLDSFSTP